MMVHLQFGHILSLRTPRHRAIADCEWRIFRGRNSNCLSTEYLLGGGSIFYNPNTSVPHEGGRCHSKAPMCVVWRCRSIRGA